MAIAYYAEEVKLPAIKKKAVGDWIRKVASLYGKRNRRYQLYLLFGREDSGG
jgi:hypothetical protein